MMPDPGAIGSFEWSEIGQLLHYLWYYFAVIIAVAFIMLTALAIIPSLVSTRQLPQDANLLRFPLIVTGLGLFGLAATLMVYTVDAAQVIAIFYDRHWM